MSVLHKVLNFIGFGEEVDDDREQTDTDAEESESSNETRRSRGNVVSIHANKPAKVVLAQPDDLDDVKDLIEQLRARKAVIINLQHHKDALVATRIGDKLHGAIFAFNGKMTTITNGIYMCTPDNYDVSGSMDVAKDIVRTSQNHSAED
jgi:cell division inhibitor SepF